MTSSNKNNKGELKKEPLERFRTFNLVFDNPLSTLVLKDLLTERAFISKYTKISVARLDEEIQALIIYDSFDINYMLTQEGIQAKSPIIKSVKKIKGSLKSMADRIIELYDLDFGYTFKDGVDFRYIENYNLQEAINDAKITKILRKEFGNDIFAVVCKYSYKTKDGESAFNIAYPTSTDLENNRILIEADEKYINRIYEALRND